MSLKKKTVIVLGNGFTKAFIPKMPLVREGFEINPLLEQFSSEVHPAANSILKGEIKLDEGQSRGKVKDIEALMTRLDNLMPYDYSRKVVHELDLLYHELKKSFVNQIKNVISENLKNTSGQLSELIYAFAKHCVTNEIDCVTFNYDDLLDQALYEQRSKMKPIPPIPLKHWHPDGGYGFYCRPAYSLIQLKASSHMDFTSMYLLKLHGSINWRIKLGAPEIFGPDNIVHKADWFPLKPQLPYEISQEEIDKLMENQLKPEGFMILPVLMKGDLKTQPIFRLIWGLAYEKLEQADEVFFVGYSLPPADIAARFLFKETLSHKPSITVINYACQAKDKNAIKKTYREVFPCLRDEFFNFAGAEAWCEGFIKGQA